MATPVVVVTTGGMPVTVATNGRGTPMTVVSNGYGIPVRVVASGGLPVVGVVTGPDVTAPIITSSNTISQPENTALVHFLSANEPVTWAKVGGADSAKFTLGSGATAGQLSLPAKDYEAPDDADANRTYIVQVQATDLAANPSAIQTITVTITDVVEIAAPVLTWTSGTTDTTPNFSVDLPSGFGDFRDAVTGDVIYLEIADNISFTTTSTETLDAGEVGGDIVLMEQTTPLADGTYYAKARLKRGATFGTYSNIETKTINTDTTAPTITSLASISLAENVALSHSLTANETVTWTKTGGSDTALFSLAGSVLSMTAKDFEAPADSDANNTYVVQVTATDTAGNATNQTITVTVTNVVEYQGPGDVFSGATAWVSPARAYSAAFAAGGTAIMDLVDSATGLTTTTINILPTGFVDVASIPGSAQRVKKLYDQTGNGNHFSTATLAQMPLLTLSSLNGLPSLACSSGSTTRLTGPAVSQAQPYTFSAVAIRTSGTSATAIIGSSTVSVGLGFNTANLARMVGGAAALDKAATDGAWHAIQGMGNGASNSAINVDGSDTTGNAGTVSFSGSLRLCVNEAGTFLNGNIVEAGFWPIASNSTQRNAVSANQHHATFGYNF